MRTLVIRTVNADKFRTFTLTRVLVAHRTEPNDQRSVGGEKRLVNGSSATV